MLDTPEAPSYIESSYLPSITTNPEFPINQEYVPVTLRLSWGIETLPNLTEWKMPAAGVYALGIEPANCRVEGRVAERERGTLEMLEPGEKRTYYLEIEVLDK